MFEDFEDRIIGTGFSREDVDIETSLRPKWIDEYIGQEKAKERLKIFINIWINNISKPWKLI